MTYTLPPHLQDAIDQLLIDEVRAEKETAVSLRFGVSLTDEKFIVSYFPTP